MRTNAKLIAALKELTDAVDGVITIETARQVWGYASYDQARKRLRLLLDRKLVRVAPTGAGTRGYLPVAVPPCEMSGTAWDAWRLMQDGEEWTKYDLATALHVQPHSAQRALRELEDADEPLVVSVEFRTRQGGRELPVYQETGAALRSLEASHAA